MRKPRPLAFPPFPLFSCSILLRELASIISLQGYFQLLLKGHGDWEDCKKADVTPFFKKGKDEDPGNYGLFILTSLAEKVIEQTHLEAISKHRKDKNTTVSTQHGFPKMKSCWKNMVTFYDEEQWLSRWGKANVADFYVSKVFNTVSCNILIDKLLKYRLQKWRVRWTEAWLNSQAQRVVISSRKSRWS